MSSIDKSLGEIAAEAKRIVDSWPKWKRNILEQSSQRTVDVPRKPVVSEDGDTMEHVCSLKDLLRDVDAHKQRRDEFAKAALAGLLANPDLTHNELGAIVRDARKVTDAMIAELDRTEGGAE